MSKYTFAHDGPVYLISDDRFEVVYYSRDKRTFKRVRRIGRQAWEETIEQKVAGGVFWMMVACAERSSRHA